MLCLFFSFFFFNDTATTEIYTLSLHDALPIYADFGGRSRTETELLEMLPTLRALRHARAQVGRWMRPRRQPVEWLFRPDRKSTRLNSSHLVISYAVFCLKKKKTHTQRSLHTIQ